MDAKVVRLKQVAQSGDIDAFYTLIREDVQLLEHIDELPFAETPLHIAASAGQIPFAVETMGLKPSFARKLDPEGFSPIHLALKNGHIELVRQLLQLDGDLVRVKGKGRLTPLHYMVESDVTVQNETVLHIALKNTRLEAFQFFVGWLANSSFENAEFNKRTVLNWKDNEGKTVLHILASTNQTQALRHLLSWCKGFVAVNHRCMRFVDVNRKNLEGKTAWDMSQEGNREIRVMLRRAGAKPGSTLPTSNGYPNPKYQRPLTVSDSTIERLGDAFLLRSLRREIRKFTVEWRNILLVVAALLVTLSFQAVLTPPGGVWQDHGQCQPYHGQGNNSSNYPKMIYLRHNHTILECERKAGTAIALQYSPFYWLFLTCKTALFLLSTSLIVLLILNSPIKALFTLLNVILCFSYFYSINTITDAQYQMIPLESTACIYFVYIQLLSWKQ
ncbi:uncharacterized protein LOC142617348 isoform X2 [Castanea sativa]|uniref:uncharacterized protein LOC142617348 isoform X2 n=1 Tax=Castanea sativa TaxID=21020 RepID=UPI003F64C024